MMMMMMMMMFFWLGMVGRHRNCGLGAGCFLVPSWRGRVVFFLAIRRDVRWNFQGKQG